jgi:L-lactate dehydrogenase (cytochrome)
MQLQQRVSSIEDVAENVSKPFWFQLYVMRDRDFIKRLIDRAKSAGCSALVLTLDLQIMGQRHKDIRNGLSAPPKITLRNMLNMSTKPRWGRACSAPNATPSAMWWVMQNRGDLTSLSAWSAGQLDPTLNWDDVQWIKERWGGTLILKGIMDAEDAEIAARSGADAIIVSNHGGRQLDGAPSSIAALPPIVRAVGEKIEVLMDGGIRSGQDVIKALALGAKGVFIGRAFVYGLGAMGEAGVTTCLNLIRNELDTTLAFCGLRDVKRVDRTILVPGTY